MTLIAEIASGRNIGQIVSFTVDTEAAVLPQNPSSQGPVAGEVLPGNHDVKRHAQLLGNRVDREAVRVAGVVGSDHHAAAIVEETFSLPQIQHAPIETHVAVAQWNPSGQVTLWAASQSPFAQRDILAQCLDIPHGNLRVISPYIGGGFGGKAGISIEANVVLMAKAVQGHPVKVRMTREEEFVATNVRQSLTGMYKVGCDTDGNLLA